METENITYEYDTESLDEFACALALGAEVVKVDKKDESRFLRFYLKANFDMDKMSLSLASKTLQIDALALCNAIRTCKSIINRGKVQ